MKSPSSTTRIMLVDDHQLFIDGLTTIIQSDPSFVISCTANNGKEALAKFDTGNIDIVLTDISMPEMDGLELTKQLKLRYPDLPVLVLSMYDDLEIIREILEVEANGYLLKSSNSRELLLAIANVADQGTYYSQKIIHHLIALQKGKFPPSLSPVKLSPREQEILELICDELSTKEIAEKLFISPRTVETHRKNILHKSGAKSLIGLIKIAVKHGWINLKI